MDLDEMSHMTCHCRRGAVLGDHDRSVIIPGGYSARKCTPPLGRHRKALTLITPPVRSVLNVYLHPLDCVGVSQLMGVPPPGL